MNNLFKINTALAQNGQIKGNIPPGGISGSAEATLPSGSIDTKASIGARPNNTITLGKNTSFAGQGSEGFFQQLSAGVDALYKYSIGVAGLLAFGILVYAGVIYIFSAGGFAKQDEAKKWITAAITGLILLLCAVLILNFLPEVTKIQDVAPAIAPPKSSSTEKGAGAVLADIKSQSFSALDFLGLAPADQQTVLSGLSNEEKFLLNRAIDDLTVQTIKSNKEFQTSLRNQLTDLFNPSSTNTEVLKREQESVRKLRELVGGALTKGQTRYEELSLADKFSFDLRFSELITTRAQFLYASKVLNLEELQFLLER